MNTFKIASVVGLLATFGCNNTSSGSNPDLAPAGFPAAPTVGAQIDRLGRPGVNTALTDPFWDTMGDGTGKAAHQAKQDAYNQNSDPTTWATQFAGAMKASLGVYDSLDQDVVAPAASCGNQAGFGALSMSDYTVLGGIVLPDDQLYVNTGSGTCSQYLGVELAVLGVANTDCGGRSPLYNTIDLTYAAFANATLALMSPVPNLNGVPQDSDGTASISAFPFLAGPL